MRHEAEYVIGTIVYHPVQFRVMSIQWHLGALHRHVHLECYNVGSASLCEGPTLHAAALCRQHRRARVTVKDWAHSSLYLVIIDGCEGLTSPWPNAFWDGRVNGESQGARGRGEVEELEIELVHRACAFLRVLWKTSLYSHVKFLLYLNLSEWLSISWFIWLIASWMP